MAPDPRVLARCRALINSATNPPAPLSAPPFDGFRFSDPAIAHKFMLRWARLAGYGITGSRPSNYSRGAARRHDVYCDKAGHHASTSIGLRKRSSRKQGCPFRVKLVQRLQYDDQWEYITMCDRHNHPASENITVHPCHRKENDDPILGLPPPKQEGAPEPPTLEVQIEQLLSKSPGTVFVDNDFLANLMRTTVRETINQMVPIIHDIARNSMMSAMAQLNPPPPPPQYGQQGHPPYPPGPPPLNAPAPPPVVPKYSSIHFLPPQVYSKDAPTAAAPAGGPAQASNPGQQQSQQQSQQQPQQQQSQQQPQLQPHFQPREQQQPRQSQQPQAQNAPQVQQQQQEDDAEDDDDDDIDVDDVSDEDEEETEL